MCYKNSWWQLNSWVDIYKFSCSVLRYSTSSSSEVQTKMKTQQNREGKIANFVTNVLIVLSILCLPKTFEFWLCFLYTLCPCLFLLYFLDWKWLSTFNHCHISKYNITFPLYINPNVNLVITTIGDVRLCCVDEAWAVQFIQQR